MELSPKVKEAHKNIKESRQFKQQLVKECAELEEFYRGDQYKQMSIPPWVPKPVTNFIHLVITTKRAALSGENPMAALRALSPLDVDNVSMLQKVYEWVWKRIKARKTVRENIESAKLFGTAIAHVYWNEKTGVLGGTRHHYEGEIGVREIDIMNFHIDPHAYRLHESSWCAIEEKRSRKWIETEFGISLKEASTDEEGYGENYNREYYSNNSDKDEMINFISYYTRKWNTDKVKVEQEVMDDLGMPTGEMEEVETDEEIGGWKHSVTYIAGNKLLKTQDLEPNVYPFAVLYDFPLRQSFWGLGTGKLIIDNQKLINKVESIIAMIGTLLQNPQKIIRKDAGINPVEAMKYSFAPGHVWVSNVPVSDAMRWADTPQIPPALINLAEMAKQNIREITGLNEAYMGQSVGSLQTSGGVNSLIDRATMRDKDQMFDIEEYVEQLTRVILAFVTTKYTEERFIRITEDPSQPEKSTKFIEFVGTEFAGMEYDLEIDVSGHAPVTQQRKEANYRELLQIQGQYNFNPRIVTPQEFVTATRMVDGDKLIARMNQEELQNNLMKLNQVAQMMGESIASGIPTEEVMGMAEQMLMQLESGQLPADPNNPQQGGIGSAADNIGQQQMQAASM